MKEVLGNSRMKRSMVHTFAGWVSIGAITLALTLPGISQGLGYIPEEVRRVAIAVNIAHTGDLNPHWFGHPATLLIYILSMTYKFMSIVGQSIFKDEQWRNIKDMYSQNGESFFYYGRIIARLAAAGAAVTTYEITKRIMGLKLAVLATLITIFNPVFITHANRLRADHILTIVLLVGTTFIARTYKENRLDIDSMKLGIVAGIGITYKYLAGSLLLAEVLAICGTRASTKCKVKAIQKMMIWCATTSFVMSPYMWLDISQVVRDLAWEATKKKFDWNPIRSLEQINDALRYSFGEIATIVFVIIIIIYLIALIAKTFKIINGDKDSLSKELNPGYDAVTIVLICYLGITLLSTRGWNATWLVPITPMISTIIVYQTSRISLPFNFQITTNSNRTARVIATCIIGGSVIANNYQAIIDIYQVRSIVPSMEVAERWIMNNIPTGSKILLWQPESDQDGLFPKIKDDQAVLYAFNENGTVRRICDVDYRSEKEVSVTSQASCYPRPRVRSQLGETAKPVISGIDYIITSSRGNSGETLIRLGAFTLSKENEFNRPVYQQIRSYPRQDNFPHGDYGMWRSIKIYKPTEIE